MDRRWFPRLFALLLYASLALPAMAQQSESARIGDLEKKLEQSLKIIEQLNERVNQLENQRAPERAVATPPAKPAPEAEQRLIEVERKVTEIADSAGKSSEDRGIPLHGFADVRVGKAGKGAGENRANGFSLGTLSFYLTPQIGDRVKTLIELAFEANDGTIQTDVERLQLGYTFSDAATLWLGRFHTPYGYWNAAYHHGAQIQTALLRPRFLDFEDKGGILPAHTMGLLLTGNIPLGSSGKVIYDGYIGNGGQIKDSTLDPNISRDDNNNKAFGFNLGYRFGSGLRGLQLGVHGLTEEIDAYASGAPLNRSRLNTLGGYGYYEGHDWELISEYYYFRNKDLSGGSGTHGSWAGYAQAGYTLGDWTPFLRLEKAKLNQNDNYFTSQTSGHSYRRYALGMRYELNAQSALKIELNRTLQPDISSGDYSEALFQYSVRF